MKLSELRSTFKEADGQSFSKSEKMIRRRICVETLRYKYYDTYNGLMAFEYRSIPAIMVSMFILFSISAFQFDNWTILAYSFPIIIALFLRQIVIKKIMANRLRIERYKIKKVLDSINDQDEVTMDLFFWLISSRNFINEIGDLGIE